MEWWLVLLLMLGGLLLLMTLGMPIGFAFIVVNIIGAFFAWGSTGGLQLMTLSFYSSVARYVLFTIPLFIFMGEILFQSGIGSRVLTASDAILGRLPGRLGVVSVVFGTLVAVLTGTGTATTAILGRGLLPDMQQRGYKSPMSLGPILGSSGLAVMIPPSSKSVFIAAIAGVSVAGLLIGGIIPGLLMAMFYFGYIVIRCRLQPSIAPSYRMEAVRFKEKFRLGAFYILPLAIIVFMVIGLILLGIATPSEAAATGAVGSLILAAVYRRLNWQVLKDCIVSTGRTTAMIFIIIGSAVAFGQLLAFVGVTKGMLSLVINLPVAPVVKVIGMLLIMMIFGMFMSDNGVLMISIPLFMPIVVELGMDPLWFAILALINSEMSATTPPFGATLFVMKAVAPSGVSMTDIYKAGLPFIGCDLMVMAIAIFFPAIIMAPLGIMVG